MQTKCDDEEYFFRIYIIGLATQYLMKEDKVTSNVYQKIMKEGIKDGRTIKDWYKEYVLIIYN